MIKGFLRVAARAAAIQIEEAAASRASARRWPEAKRQGWEFEGREGMRMAPKVVVVEKAGEPVSQKSEKIVEEALLAEEPLQQLAKTVVEATPEAVVIPQPVPQPEVELPIVEPVSTALESQPTGGALPETSVTPELVTTIPEPELPLPTVEPIDLPATQPIPAVEASQAESPALEVLEEPQESPQDIEQEAAPQITLRPSKVPSSRLGRLFHYTSLVGGLALGAAGEVARRSVGQGGEGGVMMSEANVRRLVDKLGRMRGAALKLGQFMSIQDTNMLPPQLERILQQVQASADYMPEWQMEAVMREELGDDWQSHFSSFSKIPFSAASIGQVHLATLSPTSLLLPSPSPYPADMPLAVKIQFPGIRESISSDLNNLSLLLRTSALLPRGLYLENTIKVFRGELGDECDYLREGESGERFRKLLEEERDYEVPRVVTELKGGRVLVVEMMSGEPLSRTRHLSQAVRDKIGTAVLRLCLLELFEYRFMQTDPNWANFLYDKKRDKLQLIDFGASREYSKEFMDKWFSLLKAGVEGDKEGAEKWSLELGYLTGEEVPEMLSAHIESIRLLAIPFNSPGLYDFSTQTVTDQVKALIPIMLKNRLTPPPRETYSLNRKLSGAFLLCARLGSRVPASELWEEVVRKYRVGV